MRASMRSHSGCSPRAKNMPSLVRASLTSLAPVSSLTVSERASRSRASATSCVALVVATAGCRTRSTRGCSMLASTWHLAVAGVEQRAVLERQRLGHRRAARAGRWRAHARSRKPRSVSSSATIATSSSQPLASIDFSTASGGWSAVAWSMIHWRSSGVICCAAGAPAAPCRCVPAAEYQAVGLRRVGVRSDSLRWRSLADPAGVAIALLHRMARHQPARPLGEEADDLVATVLPVLEDAFDDARLQPRRAHAAEIFLRRQVDDHRPGLGRAAPVQMVGERDRPSTHAGWRRADWPAPCPSRGGRAAAHRAGAARRTGRTGSPDGWSAQLRSAASSVRASRPP